MHTVLPTTCSTVAPMARGGAVDIPGNGTGQIIASSSTYIHVQGAYGARTGAVSSAADGRPEGDGPLSVPAKFGCMAMAPWYLLFDNVACNSLFSETSTFVPTRNGSRLL